jgi:hypothetical protein
MAPLLMTLSLSSFVFAEMNNDNLTQAFESHPRYKEYDLTLKNGKQEEAIKIKREILTELTRATLNQYYSELSNRSRE